MTDITELAQILKAAAENAIGAHKRLAAYPYGEIIDISQHEGEQIDIDITDLNEFNKEANPVNILALVESLEKAQQERDEFRNRLKLERSILEDADKRIAELESRTVTINTPDARDEDYDWDDQTPSEAFNTCRMICALMFRQSLRAAGIKVEAE
ncbi:ead/Ea22-like family protein [Klebsiella pneumoniae]